MFATLAGGYPRPDLGPDATIDDVVRAVLADQEEAGLEILSDGHVRHEDRVSSFVERLEGFEIGGPAPYLTTGRTYLRPTATREPRWDGPVLVDEWRATAAATQLPVKATVIGPYTLGHLAGPGAVGRERLTIVLADILGHELRALFAAGCPLVQVDEDAAVLVGTSQREQGLFKSAHRRLTSDLTRNHMSLAVSGGSIAEMPPDILFDGLYRSYLFDVLDGHMSWRQIAVAPGERGIIPGVVDARSEAPDDPEHVLWAALFAASIRERGGDRVGIAPSGSLAGLRHEVARTKLSVLGAAAAAGQERLASGEPLDQDALAFEGMARGWLPDMRMASRTAATPASAESA
jgi:5-methyltetrahydropteroyltriglutamate--homocysteine methyltransferase